MRSSSTPSTRSTVMHEDGKIHYLMAERRSICNQVTELTNRIKNKGELHKI
ncbi:hypothetical protein ACIQU3_30900 [Streptomyces sp. NPDC101110]|uniref:hypothetical protein n=1 Tax=Streptomyces sp. NPDC101110 TaxID=3366104 RepID=UPI0037FD75C3